MQERRTTSRRGQSRGRRGDKRARPEAGTGPVHGSSRAALLGSRLVQWPQCFSCLVGAASTETSAWKRVRPGMTDNALHRRPPP